jgi:hypothetical protein
MTKREPSAWVYNWANLFLRDIKMQTWASRLGESRIWDGRYGHESPQDSDPRMTVMMKASSDCKQQIHPLVRGWHTSTSPPLSDSNRNAVLGPRWSLARRQTGQLKIGCDITLTLDTYMYTSVTCKTVNNRYPQGTGLLTNNYVRTLQIFKFVNTDDRYYWFWPQ